jgi:hypothetical protein
VVKEKVDALDARFGAREATVQHRPRPEVEALNDYQWEYSILDEDLAVEAIRKRR